MYLAGSWVGKVVQTDLIGTWAARLRRVAMEHGKAERWEGIGEMGEREGRPEGYW